MVLQSFLPPRNSNNVFKFPLYFSATPSSIPLQGMSLVLNIGIGAHKGSKRNTTFMTCLIVAPYSVYNHIYTCVCMCVCIYLCVYTYIFFSDRSFSYIQRNWLYNLHNWFQCMRCRVTKFHALQELPHSHLTSKLLTAKNMKKTISTSFI